MESQKGSGSVWSEKVSRKVEKAFLLASLLPKHPLEFYDRLMAPLEVRMERYSIRAGLYEPRELADVISDMNDSIGQDLDAFVHESACAEVLADVVRRIDSIRSHAPFTLAHNADFTLARFCYSVCRMLRPSIVLETGLAYGVTSAFISMALEVNGKGVLHSVDLPPLAHGADQFVGILIPEYLGHRLRLHRGVSKRVLPSLLPQLGRVDMFVHDSLHTCRNMRREFRLVAPYLGRPGVVIADDVEGNDAFLEWVNRAHPSFWATLNSERKDHLFGVGVFL